MSERRYPEDPRAPAVLAVDVGGSHVKAVLNGIDERRRFVSGKKLTGKQMVDGVLELTKDWDYTHVTVGLPAPVVGGRVLHDPVNLGKGWVQVDYEKAFAPDLKAGADIFDLRGVDRERGVVVVVRPDQYVAHVLPLEARADLAAFFAAFLLDVGR